MAEEERKCDGVVTHIKRSIGREGKVILMELMSREWHGKGELVILLEGMSRD